MRTSRKLSIAIACVTAALITALCFLPAREPSYNGHSLTYWLELNGGIGSSDFVSSPEVTKSTEAVRAIGPKAIPLLLEWIEYEPGAVRAAAPGLAVKTLPQKALTNAIVLTALAGPAQARANNALTGFLLLGPMAAPAITNLVRLSYRPPQSWTSTRAISALGNIGEHALPALEQILCDPNHPNRARAFEALDYMLDRGLSIDHAVPTLKQCLQESNQSIAAAAARTLAKLPSGTGDQKIQSANSTNTHAR